MFGLQHAPTHGLGWHVPFAGPHTPLQLACVVVMHVNPAVVWIQHGPAGGHGLTGRHPIDVAGIWPVGHCVPVTTVHAPVAGLQHVITGGGGHGGFGGQNVPIPCHNPPFARQLLSVVIAHPPVAGLQHAPRHGSGWHELFAPSHCPLQFACVVMKHVAAVATQHAPTVGHGSGLQINPVATMNPAGHGPRFEMHKPVVGLQHNTGHRFGWHVPFC